MTIVAEHATRVVALAGGYIVFDGTPAALFARPRPAGALCPASPTHRSGGTARQGTPAGAPGRKQPARASRGTGRSGAMSTVSTATRRRWSHTAVPNAVPPATQPDREVHCRTGALAALDRGAGPLDAAPAPRNHAHSRPMVGPLTLADLWRRPAASAADRAGVRVEQMRSSRRIPTRPACWPASDRCA